MLPLGFLGEEADEIKRKYLQWIDDTSLISRSLKTKVTARRLTEVLHFDFLFISKSL